MKLMMSLFGLLVLLGSSGCIVKDRGGAYDGYYNGYGSGYRYDHDNDRWNHDHYYHDYRY